MTTQEFNILYKLFVVLSDFDLDIYCQYNGYKTLDFQSEVTKYRKPVITGRIAERTRKLIRMVCNENENDVEIISGHVSKDHIHLLVSSPPHLSISKMEKMKSDDFSISPLIIIYK